jgi:hypothetical protein
MLPPLPLSGAIVANCRLLSLLPGVFFLSPMSAITAEMPATAAVFAVVAVIYYR